MKKKIIQFSEASEPLRKAYKDSCDHSKSSKPLRERDTLQYHFHNEVKIVVRSEPSISSI